MKAMDLSNIKVTVIGKPRVSLYYLYLWGTKLREDERKKLKQENKENKQ